MGLLLDKKRLDQIHSLMLDWGKWVTAGRAVPRLYATSQWPSGRPVEARRSPKHRKPLLPLTQPHETRQIAPKQPIMVDFEWELEKIHPVVLKLDDKVKNIVICLYIRGMCFSDITKNLGISSRHVGDCKYKALKAVSPVVR